MESASHHTGLGDADVWVKLETMYSNQLIACKFERRESFRILDRRCAMCTITERGCARLLAATQIHSLLLVNCEPNRLERRSFMTAVTKWLFVAMSALAPGISLLRLQTYFEWLFCCYASCSFIPYAETTTYVRGFPKQYCDGPAHSCCQKIGRAHV